MTPILVLVFGIQPLAAVSSDLVASVFMKPVGASVHIRRGTVNWQLVKWLCVGLGAGRLRRASSSCGPSARRDLQGVVKVALGYALLIAAAGLIDQDLPGPARAHAAAQPGLAEATVASAAAAPGAGPADVHRAIGAVGGLVVGMTCVGSGSLIIIALLAALPDAARQPARRHRPGAGGAAGRRRGARARAVRRLPARRHGVAARRLHPRRLPRCAVVHAGARRHHPPRSRPRAARLRAEAGRSRARRRSHGSLPRPSWSARWCGCRCDVRTACPRWPASSCAAAGPLWPRGRPRPGRRPSRPDRSSPHRRAPRGPTAAPDARHGPPPGR